MARGQKTGGRQKGVPNKKRADFVEKLASTGLTPLEFLTNVMRDESVPRPERVDAAKAAAPYIHSKMPTAIVMPPPPGSVVSSDDEQLLDLYLNGVHAEADEE